MNVGCPDECSLRLSKHDKENYAKLIRRKLMGK